MKRRTCPNPDCGKDTRTIGDFCPYCATSLTPIDSEIISEESNRNEERGGSIMSTTKKILIGIGAILLLLGAYWLGAYNASKPVGNNDKTVASSTVNTPAAATDNSKNIAPVVNNGINKAKDEMFLVQAGDVVVGDISVKNTDGTMENLYDNRADTALVVIFDKPTWVVGPFNGAFLTKQASQAETDQLIKDKQQDVQNYREVIVTNWPSDVSKTLPAVTK